MGWLEKFSHAEVPNAKNLVPGLAHPDWDPNREYSLPWAMYMTGIAYDIKRTGRPLTSVNDIYDPKFRGHVSMLNQMRDTLALVFLGMGITPEKATYADAQAAVAKMKENVANGQIRQFFGNDYERRSRAATSGSPSPSRATSCSCRRTTRTSASWSRRKACTTRSTTWSSPSGRPIARRRSLGWDNGDRTVLVNSELGGVTFGWNLLHTAQDELFAAIEGTAFHTRIILERMAEHAVPVHRVINAGGIPQNNPVLNQVYADVLGKPVLVPSDVPTSLGSGIFAMLAAKVFLSIEEAQAKLCPQFKVFTPQPAAVSVYEQLYPLYRKAYFALGTRSAEPTALGDILPQLRKIASQVQASGNGADGTS